MVCWLLRSVDVDVEYDGRKSTAVFQWYLRRGRVIGSWMGFAGKAWDGTVRERMMGFVEMYVPVESCCGINGCFTDSWADG